MEGNRESGGRVKRDTADGRDAGFHTHLDYLNCRRPGTAVHGAGMRCPGRRKHFDHLLKVINFQGFRCQTRNTYDGGG